MSGRSPDSPIGSVKRSITNRDKQSNGTVEVNGKRSESGKSRDVDKPPAGHNKKKKNEVTPIGGGQRKAVAAKPSGGGGYGLDEEEEKVDWKGMFL